MSFVSVAAVAGINTKTCPKKFTLNYENIKRLPLTPEIENDFTAFTIWEALEKVKSFSESYTLTTPANVALCVYVNDHSMAFLVPGDGTFELTISLDPTSGMGVFVRTNVTSFTNGKVAVSNEESDRTFYTQVLSDSGSFEVLGTINVAIAEAVKTK
jgi:hypothetical protein